MQIYNYTQQRQGHETIDDNMGYGTINGLEWAWTHNIQRESNRIRGQQMFTWDLWASRQRIIDVIDGP